MLSHMQYNGYSPKVMYRLHMPSFSDSLNLLQRVESGMGCSTHTQPCSVFGYNDFCGSTALGMPESVGR